MHHSMLRQRLACVLLAALCCCGSSFAMTHTFTGAVDASWANGANWTGGKPTSAEAGGTIVEFNTNSTSTADIVGLIVDQIHFKGSGNTINGSTPLKIDGSNLSINIQDDAGGNTLSNTLPLVLVNATTIINVATGTLTMSGNISGAFGLAKSGAGATTFAMATNTYGGNTTVVQGTLQLNSNGVNTAIPGDLFVGSGTLGAGAATVKLLQSAEIVASSNVTVRSDGVFDFNNFLQSIATLSVTSGSVTLGSGTLTLSGGITMTGGTIAATSGTISLGGNITATSSATAGAAITATLALNATRTFTVNSGAVKPELKITGQIANGGATSGIFKTGTGTMDLIGFASYTYTGTTTVDKGALEINTTVGVVINSTLVIGNGVDPVGSATLRELNSSDISSTAAVQIAASGVLDMNAHTDTVGPLTGLGQIQLTSGAALTCNSDNSSTSFDGTINGTGGVFRKAGTGTLTLTGNNPFTGTTIVALGTLLLNSNGVNTAVQGSLTIGNGTLAANSAIVKLMQGSEIADGSAVTVNSDGKFDLNGNFESIGALNVNAGNVTLGAGNLTTLGLLSMTGGTISATGGMLNLGNDVTATSTATAASTISAPIALNAAARSFTITTGGTQPELTLTGVISDGTPGSGLTKTGTGILVMQGTAANTYTGVTTVDKGTLQIATTVGQNIIGNIVIGNAVDAANSAILRDMQSSDIKATALMTINPSGQFNLNGFSETIGALSGSGSINLGAGALTFGSANLAQTYAGVVSGTGIFRKVGTGTQTLTGNNTLTGPTQILAGTLLVNGSEPVSPVSVSGGTLGGTGTVGNVTVTASSIAPGTATPGQLSTGNLMLDTNSTITFRLNDSTATGFDSLNVTGTVTLGNCAIQLTISPTFAGGGTLTLIANDAADAVVGVSKSFTENQAVPLNANASNFSYVGGTGNDVVLKIANVAPALTSGAFANPSPGTATLPVTFTVGASDANNDTLTYAWNFGDGMQVSGATVMHTYATPGTYSVSVTINDGHGATINSSTSITVNSAVPPTVQINATPSTSGVGQQVTFSVPAGVPGVPLTYTWNFGDGSSGMGATVSHTFASAGSYSVTVNVTDGLGGSGNGAATQTVNAPLIGSGNDSDGDGFSDGFENLVGTNPSDAASTITGQPAGAGSILPLTVSKASIKLNFAKSGSDTIQFSGTLSVPAGFTLGGAKVSLDVSGVSRTFSLDAKGSAKAADGSAFKLSAKATKGKVAAQTAKYAVTLPKGTFAATLAPTGLTGAGDAKGKSVKVAFTVVFNQMLLQKIQTMSFSAKKGKTGAAK